MANVTGTKNNDILLDPSTSPDTFNGKGGIDTLVSDFSWGSATLFDMNTGERTVSGTVFDTFKNIENLTVGGAAHVIGDDKNNVIKFVDTSTFNDNQAFAGGGNDKVLGRAGDDILFGNAGNDTLKGGEDDDILRGGKGADKLYGGEGQDNLRGDKGKDILDGGDGEDILHGGDGKDVLDGGDGDDQLFGDNGNDILKGGDGQDELHGGNGNDTLQGGYDDDQVYGDGGDDIVKGGNGDDNLFGQIGDDTLKGGDGNDILDGGVGNDVLIGGEGEDTFVFQHSGSDVIEDFEDGVDLLDLSGFGFANVDEALSHFFERGSATNDVVGFEHDGTTIKIKGLDLADIDASDIII